MSWLVWRRQRAALLLAGALLAGAALVLVVGRLLLTGAAAELGAGACLTGGTPGCRDEPRYSTFVQEFQDFHNWSSVLLLFAAPLAGLIAGAGLFAGEFERRTHLFALTQRIRRLRWWATGIAVTLVPTVLAVGIFTLVTRWAREPFTVLYAEARVGPAGFDLSGVVPMGYAVATFALTVAAGLLLRSSLATIVATVVGWLLVSVVLVLTRYDILPDEIVVFPLGGSPSIDFYAGQYQHGPIGFLDAAGRRIGSSDVPANCFTESTAAGYEECLRAAGLVSSYHPYQPDSYYWPLQFIVLGILLGLSALLLAVSAVVLRRAPVRSG